MKFMDIISQLSKIENAPSQHVHFSSVASSDPEDLLSESILSLREILINKLEDLTLTCFSGAEESQI